MRTKEEGRKSSRREGRGLKDSEKAGRECTVPLSSTPVKGEGEAEEGGCGLREKRVKDGNQGKRQEEFRKGGYRGSKVREKAERGCSECEEPSLLRVKRG